jgi:hypothetical protein
MSLCWVSWHLFFVVMLSNISPKPKICLPTLHNIYSVLIYKTFVQICYRRLSLSSIFNTCLIFSSNTRAQVSVAPFLLYSSNISANIRLRLKYLEVTNTISYGKKVVWHQFFIVMFYNIAPKTEICSPTLHNIYTVLIYKTYVQISYRRLSLSGIFNTWLICASNTRAQVSVAPFLLHSSNISANIRPGLKLLKASNT